MTSTRLCLAVAVAISGPPVASALAETAAMKPIELAQAPGDAEKAKQEKQRRQRAAPPPPPAPPPVVKAAPPQPRAAPPPVVKAAPPQPRFAPPQPRATPPNVVAPPPVVKAAPPQPRFAPPQRRADPPNVAAPPVPPKGSAPPDRTPAAVESAPPQVKSFGRRPSFTPETPRADRGGPRPGPTFKGGDQGPPLQATPGKGPEPVAPSFQQKTLPGQPRVGRPDLQRTPPPAIPATPIPQVRTKAAGGPPPRFDAIKSGRTQRTEDGGRRTVIVEPGDSKRVIVKQNNRTIIHHDETERFRRLHANAQTRRRPDGNTETFFVRGDGVRVVTVTDRDGRLVHRYRRDRSGREFSIIDNRRFLRNAGIAAGIGALGIAIALNLPPPRIVIPRERYIVDYAHASDDDLYEALSAPPVEALERAYSLDEVRYSYELRQRMRRIDLDTITFEFGSWEVGGEQFPKLERMARAMLRMLERNPNEVFLVGAHTDAVGTEEDNLSLSDRRAETVAQILSEEFGVPAENLVTQGYGEQHLRVETEAAEPRNRRVEVQRITPLLAQDEER